MICYPRVQQAVGGAPAVRAAALMAHCPCVSLTRYKNKCRPWQLAEGATKCPRIDGHWLGTELLNWNASNLEMTENSKALETC